MLDVPGRSLLRAVLAAAWTRDTARRRADHLSAVTTILTAFTGPSPVALTLGPRTSLLPPWYLPVSLSGLSEWVVVPLLWLGLSVGAVGLWIAWRAVGEGWRRTTASCSPWGPASTPSPRWCTL